MESPHDDDHDDEENDCDCDCDMVEEQLARSKDNFNEMINREITDETDERTTENERNDRNKLFVSLNSNIIINSSNKMRMITTVSESATSNISNISNISSLSSLSNKSINTRPSIDPNSLPHVIYEDANNNSFVVLFCFNLFCFVSLFVLFFLLFLFFLLIHLKICLFCFVLKFVFFFAPDEMKEEIIQTYDDSQPNIHQKQSKNDKKESLSLPDIKDQLLGVSDESVQI